MWRSLGLTLSVLLPAPLLLSSAEQWHATDVDTFDFEPTSTYEELEPSQRERRPPRPPQEAIDACRDLQAGAACRFAGRNGETVEGTCWRPQDAQDKPLACRPQGRRGPPPQG